MQFIKDSKKYQIPENFDIETARDLFKNPEVNTDVDLVWGTCDDAELIHFLVEEKGFNPARVEASINKIKKTHGKPAQLVLENFFGKATITKRKPVDTKPVKKARKK